MAKENDSNKFNEFRRKIYKEIFLEINFIKGLSLRPRGLETFSIKCYLDKYLVVNL